MDNNRELVVSMLMELTRNKHFSHILMNEVLSKYDYKDARDKAFIKRVTEGTLERKIELDYIINQFSKTPVKKMKPFIACLLEMSVYQIIYMEQIPDSAVCNEAVKLGEKKGFRNLKGFINGVLRTIVREKESITYPSEQQEPVAYLSVRCSMPEWIVKKCIAQLGYETAKKMFHHFLEIPPIRIRLREDIPTAKQSDWCKQMEELSIGFNPHPYLPYAYEIRKSEGVQRLPSIPQMPGYQEGYFVVQDISSMLVCETAGIKRGDFVLDVCAAPGGKTLHAAGKTGPEGTVIARDVTENKTDIIKENLQRLDYRNVKVVTYNACIYDTDMEQKADVVLADVPCSGLGVIGKKKDIKYRLEEEQIKSLISLQKEILSVVWNYVRPGGILMYSTCTVNCEENQDMVEWFTSKYPFETVSLSNNLPDELKEYETKNGMLQLIPGIHQSDGFFLAKMQRMKE